VMSVFWESSIRGSISVAKVSVERGFLILRVWNYWGWITVSVRYREWGSVRYSGVSDVLKVATNGLHWNVHGAGFVVYFVVGKRLDN